MPYISLRQNAAAAAAMKSKGRHNRSCDADGAEQDAHVYHSGSQGNSGQGFEGPNVNQENSKTSQCVSESAVRKMSEGQFGGG